MYTCSYIINIIQIINLIYDTLILLNNSMWIIIGIYDNFQIKYS